MNDMSMTMTPSRQARCSSAHRSNQEGRPHVGSPGSGTAPGPAYQSGDSQPETSRKYAPCAASRSCSALDRAPRAVCSARPGAWEAYTSPSASTVRVARYSGLAWYGCSRSILIPVTSMSGRPSTIHWATARPTPPPVRIPIEFSPAATK